MASPNEEPKNGKRPARVLPDPAICRARRRGFGDYVECLVDAPRKCRHALGLGHDFFCMHPQWKEIAARTKAEERKKKSNDEK